MLSSKIDPESNQGDSGSELMMADDVVDDQIEENKDTTSEQALSEQARHSSRELNMIKFKSGNSEASPQHLTVVPPKVNSVNNAKKRSHSSRRSNSINQRINSQDTLKVENSATIPGQQIVVGVCCMAKKLNSKPMQSIIKNLKKYKELQIIEFEEDLILNLGYQDWPKVEVLICFYSSGFPMDKGIQYVNTYKPIQINDLEAQKDLWDRRKIYQKLKANNIPMARHFILNRKSQPFIDQDYLECYNEQTKGRGEYLIKYAEEMREKYQSGAANKSDNNSPRDDKNAELDSSNQFSPELRVNEKKVKASSSSERPENETGIFEYADEGRATSVNAGLFDPTKEELKAIQIKRTLSPRKDSGLNIEFNMPEKEEILYQDPELDFKEYEDFIMIDGQKLQKPFVEKPVNAEDHEIRIYYSNLNPCGSGYNVLFRKTNNYSGQFIPHSLGQSTIRTEGSYIYEEFLPTDGFDIKIYTVGGDYAHAEARKCPTLDGVVQRGSDGKEVRYPVNLTQEEKEIARKIQREFKQHVCGFDLLRSKGKSYVCDVNGFSLVKSSAKYYIDCGSQIRRIIHQKLRRSFNNLHELMRNNPLNPQIQEEEGQRSYRPDQLKNKNGFEGQWELRSVVGVFRHGDRTPKQKMKMKTKDSIFLKFFEGKNVKKEVKLKTPAQLQKLLDMSRKLLNHILESGRVRDSESKIYTENERERIAKFLQLINVLERDKFEGLNRKVQLKPLKWAFDEAKQCERVSEALFVLKWGGELTHSGVQQAVNLGESFREKMYIESEDKDPTGNPKGLLRLHSTYRHDLKCFTSDEGRCQKTAAAFLKGLLFLDGALAPVLAIMVRNDEAVQGMLNDSEEASKLLSMVKEELHELFHSRGPIYDKYMEMYKEEPPKKVKDYLLQIGTPIAKLKQIYELIKINSQSMKTILDKLDPWQTHTYLHTSREFEKIFNLEEPIDDSKQLQKQMEEFGHKFMAKDYKSASNKSPPKEVKISELNAHSAADRDQGASPLKQEDQKGGLKSNQRNSNHSSQQSLKQISGTDCQAETLLLMYKRWKKIEEDFMKVTETGEEQYDISKLPEVCDNIKYDMIHYPDVRENPYQDQLLRLAQLMCMINVPFEYGITMAQKMKIGMKITHKLIDKIHHDLVWWKIKGGQKGQEKQPKNTGQNEHFQDENQDWDKKGLDPRSMDAQSKVKSHWRHVRSRLYFTSASHMYTLLNVIKYGLQHVNNITDATDNQKEDKHIAEDTLRLDFMSGIFFRVFENLHCEEHDPARFKLDIMVNRGSIVLPDTVKDIKDHCIPILLDNTFSKTLTLEDIDHFFLTLLNMQYNPDSYNLSPSDQGPHSGSNEFSQKESSLSQQESPDNKSDAQSENQIDSSKVSHRLDSITFNNKFENPTGEPDLSQKTTINSLAVKVGTQSENSDVKNSEDNYMNTNEIEKMLKSKKSSKSSFSNI